MAKKRLGEDDEQRADIDNVDDELESIIKNQESNDYNDLDKQKEKSIIDFFLDTGKIDPKQIAEVQ